MDKCNHEYEYIGRDEHVCKHCDKTIETSELPCSNCTEKDTELLKFKEFVEKVKNEECTDWCGKSGSDSFCISCEAQRLFPPADKPCKECDQVGYHKLSCGNKEER